MLVVQTLISRDFFSLQKSDVASNRVYETVGVSDERSFPGPQLSKPAGFEEVLADPSHKHTVSPA